MKRVLLLAAISFAAFGTAIFTGACIGDEPGPLPAIGDKDAEQPDGYVPPGSDGGDAGQPVPKTILGLELWLDADDANSVQVDTTQGTVIAWLDKSGAGAKAKDASTTRDYAPPSPAVAPKFAVRSMNESKRNAISFLKTSKQYLAGPTFKHLAAAEAFIVFQALQAPPRPPPAEADAGQNYGIWQYGSYQSCHPDSNNQVRDTFGTGGVSLVSGEVPTAKYWDRQIFGIATTNEKYSAYYNGKSLVANQGEHKLRGVVFNGAGSLLGATNSATGNIEPNDDMYFNGYIGEVLIYDHELSPADHETVGAYLAAKWGITFVKPDGGPLSQ